LQLGDGQETTRVSGSLTLSWRASRRAASCSWLAIVMRSRSTSRKTAVGGRDEQRARVVVSAPAGSPQTSGALSASPPSAGGFHRGPCPALIIEA